jgi:hypothetical protein
VDSRPQVLEGSTPSQEGFAPKTNQNVLAPPQAEEQVANALVVVHGFSVEDETDRRPRFVGQGEPLPPFGLALVSPQKDEGKFLPDGGVQGMARAGLGCFLNEVLDAVGRNLVSGPLQQTFRQFEKLLQKIPFPQQHEILNGFEGDFN